MLVERHRLPLCELYSTSSLHSVWQDLNPCEVTDMVLEQECGPKGMDCGVCNMAWSRLGVSEIQWE